MRGFIITFAVLAALNFLYQAKAAAIEENPSPADAEEAKSGANLLDVEAGGEHGNDSPRNARHYGYGWGYGWGHPWSYYSHSWGRPWGGYGWGAWGGYGGGYGGGWGGRPWNYWG